MKSIILKLKHRIIDFINRHYCSHKNSKIIYSDNACAIEECPDCGKEIIHGG